MEVSETERKEILENQVERLVGEKKQMEALIKKAYEIIEEFRE